LKKEKGIITLVLSAVASFILSLSILLPFNDSVVHAQEVESIKTTNKGKINRTPLKYNDLVEAFPNVMYDSKSITCLARNIYFEARNESVFGQHMVAWTTLNRVKHKRWRSTVCGVVYQRKQFSWTIKYSKSKTYNKVAYKRAVLIAKDTLHEFYTGGKDLSNGALFYHADYVNPSWNKKLIRLTQVDTHIFYKHK